MRPQHTRLPSWSLRHVAMAHFGDTRSRSVAAERFRGPAPAFDRKTDVVYGRKHGMALTMDVFTPKDNPNGAGHRLDRQRRLVLQPRGRSTLRRSKSF